MFACRISFLRKGNEIFVVVVVVVVVAVVIGLFDSISGPLCSIASGLVIRESDQCSEDPVSIPG